MVSTYLLVLCNGHLVLLPLLHELHHHFLVLLLGLGVRGQRSGVHVSISIASYPGDHHSVHIALHAEALYRWPVLCTVYSHNKRLAGQTVMRRESLVKFPSPSRF